MNKEVLRLLAVGDHVNRKRKEMLGKIDRIMKGKQQKLEAEVCLFCV